MFSHKRPAAAAALILPVLFIFSLSALNAQPSDFIQTVQRETLPQEQMLSSGVYSPFGNYFGVISRNNRVRMYDSSHRLLWTYRGRGHHGTAPALSISRNEKFTFFPGYGSESAIAMVSTSNGELIRLFNGHSSEVRSLILTPDNSYLISFAPGELFLWRQNGTGYTLAHKLNTGDLRISSMAVSPDGNTLVLGNSSDYINLYRIDAENHRLLPRGELRPNSYFSNTGYLNGLAFSPDGQWLAAGVREEITIYRREETGYEPFQIISELDDGYVYSLAFAPDGESFFAGFGGGTVGIWRLGNLPETREAGGTDAAEEGWKYQSGFVTGQEYIAGLAFHPMGQSLATVSISQNGVVLWALEGVEAGPLGRLSRLLMVKNGAGRPGTAQSAALTAETAEIILEDVGKDALAPRGMFETTEAYDLRLKQTAERAHDLVLDLVMEHFHGKYERDSGNLLFPPERRGSYDADRMFYSLPVLGANAGIHMDPGEAEQLYIHWQEAEVQARPGQEDEYDWMLLHPVYTREYPLIFDRDPIQGTTREGEARIIPRLSVDERLFLEDIAADPIFPALYRSYAKQSIVEMNIANKWSEPVEALNVVAEIEGYTSSIELIHAGVIPPGASMPLPVHLEFSNEIMNLQTVDSLGMTLSFSYIRRGAPYHETLRIPLSRMSYNALQWDDDRKIAAFLHTSQDPEIMQITGNILSDLPPAVTAMFKGNIQTAATMFEWIRSRGIVYRPDPRTPYAGVSMSPEEIDFVQYPRETLNFRSGDCDDLSVLYASLLESASIPTAFITTPGHIFLALDSGIPVQQSSDYFADPGALLPRDGTLWLPVETTLLQEGFFPAWHQGARQWQSASAQGDADFFTTAESWMMYPPGQPPQTVLSGSIEARHENRDGETVQEASLSHIRSYRDRQIERLISLRSLENPQNTRDYTRRGIIYARFGLNTRAGSDFREAMNRGESVEPLLHLARLASASGDSSTALEYLREAGERQPDNPRVQLNLAAEHLLNGDLESARSAYKRLSVLDPRMAERFPLFTDSLQDGSAALRSAGDAASPGLRNYLDSYWSE